LLSQKKVTVDPSKVNFSRAYINQPVPPDLKIVKHKMSSEQNQQQPEFRTSDTTEAKYSTPSALRDGQSDSENNNSKRIVYVQDPNSQMVSQVLNPPYEKLGNPGPMGLYSFAITTFMLGLYHCGAGLPNSNPAAGVGPDQAVLGTAFFMGGIVQFAAGMWEMRVGNSFGATLHSSCKYTTDF
jgi:hypothetical protein